MSSQLANYTIPSYVQLFNNIFVQSNSVEYPNFLEETKEDFKTILLGEVGQRLIKKIEQGQHAVFIEYGKNCKGKAFDGTLSRSRGWGADTVIHYDCTAQNVFDCKGSSIESPRFIKLAHEMIHALHNSYGKNAQALKCKHNNFFWKSQEEFKTIFGNPSKNLNRKRPKITENAIRAERGLEERCSHFIDVPRHSDKPPKIKKMAQDYLIASVAHRILKKPPVSASLLVKKIPQISKIAIL